MKPKTVLTTFLIFLGYQSFSQGINVKGRIIDYETNEPMFFAGVISRISDNNGGFKNESGAMTDKDGKFEFRGNPEYIVINFTGYYSLMILNIPKQNKDIDLDEVIMVQEHYWDASDLSDQELKEQREILEKNVIEDFTLKIYGKALKPSFSGSRIYFDFNKNQKD